MSLEIKVNPEYEFFHYNDNGEAEIHWTAFKTRKELEELENEPEKAEEVDEIDLYADLEAALMEDATEDIAEPAVDSEESWTDDDSDVETEDEEYDIDMSTGFWSNA